MTRRWPLWIGTVGAGACIAFSTGYGVAAAEPGAADTDTNSASEAAPNAADSETDATDDVSTTSTGDAAETEDAAAEDAAAEDAAAEDAAAEDAAAEDAAAEDAAAEDAAAEDAAAEDAAAEGSDGADAVTESTVGTVDLAPEQDTSGGLDLAAAVGSTPRRETAASAALAPQAIPASVSGVKTGQSTITIPVGTNGYTTRASWYLPTQSDGSVTATGVIWLQHGFLGNRAAMSKLARTLSQQTNSVVVTPFISSFPLRCSACSLNGVAMQEAVAELFSGDRAALDASAVAAGFAGVLPADFVMSGQSAGGGFATAVGGYYNEDTGNTGSLRGVVLFDGFARPGVLPAALENLENTPVYTVAAPPQSWNGNGATTAELVAARPGQFVGVTLAGGSHADALIGGNAIFDIFAQLVSGVSPKGNTEAVYTLATGWINDMYQGLGPLDGQGIYGAPDEYLIFGDARGVVLAPPPIVDLDSYLGTWFEVGSVKQFFSIGLVNTKAVYSLNPDESIKVENSGNYFVNNGPESTIVGSALPVDTVTNNKLNVTFFGPASSRPPGNYWIVDLDPQYQWAVVTDSTGLSGFLLSREPIVSAEFYQELLDRASVKGVVGRITPTRQPAAEATTTSV